MGTLSVRGITKKYGSVTAIDHLNFDVHDGEFFVILGPSGAGKTTTLKSVAGLVDMEDGSVAVNGVDLTLVEPYHRNIAMAFESYALYPNKTVRQNLASPLKSGRTGHHSREEIEQRILTVTRTLGIDHLLDRYPREVSNGQRQRTALGRVLVRPADVYLLDEPLSHLDAKLRATMRAELKAIAQKSNTTTIYVTHDYQEALALADRIAVLRHGKFVQIGTPVQIWREPIDSFVAKSLGQPEINVIDAVVANGRISALAGAINLPKPDGLPEGKVRLGLRPSELIPGVQAGGVQIKGTVRIAERLGRDIEMEVAVGDGHLIVVAHSSKAVAEGKDVVLSIDVPRIHVFAGTESGEDTPRLGSAQQVNTVTKEVDQ
jgi:multiple sugar transport system ATP-binding protein